MWVFWEVGEGITKSSLDSHNVKKGRVLRTLAYESR